MIRVIAVVTLLQAFASAKEDESCPNKYRRLSPDHSFCRPPNDQCQFVTKGLQDEEDERAEILRAHNLCRSRIATGSQPGAPAASNMLEMSWDEELAKIAQKWAEQCNQKHDCNACRSVRGFSVGQNTFHKAINCKVFNCNETHSEWDEVIKAWYIEVADRNFKIVPSVNNGAVTTNFNHFTQVAWAKTYKVGCGYVAYKEKTDKVTQLYVCNYGPTGNVMNQPLYKVGKPCTACPKNSCCEKTCEDKTYRGLCRLLSGGPPIYAQRPDILYHCDFQKGDPNCDFDSEGKWKVVKTSGGNLLSVIVKKKESATAHFRNSVKTKKGGCMIVTLRKGANVAGEKEDSTLEVEFQHNGQKETRQLYTSPGSVFHRTLVHINYDGNIKFSIKMSVPAGIPDQYTDIKLIEITGESCKYG